METKKCSVKVFSKGLYYIYFAECWTDIPSASLSVEIVKCLLVADSILKSPADNLAHYCEMS